MLRMKLADLEYSNLQPFEPNENVMHEKKMSRHYGNGVEQSFTGFLLEMVTGFLNIALTVPLVFEYILKSCVHEKE